MKEWRKSSKPTHRSWATPRPGRARLRMVLDSKREPKRGGKWRLVVYAAKCASGVLTRIAVTRHLVLLPSPTSLTSGGAAVMATPRVVFPCRWLDGVFVRGGGRVPNCYSPAVDFARSYRSAGWRPGRSSTAGAPRGPGRTPALRPRLNSAQLSTASLSVTSAERWVRLISAVAKVSDAPMSSAVNSTRLRRSPSSVSQTC